MKHLSTAISSITGFEFVSIRFSGIANVFTFFLAFNVVISQNLTVVNWKPGKEKEEVLVDINLANW